VLDRLSPDGHGIGLSPEPFVIRVDHILSRPFLTLHHIGVADFTAIEAEI
jgi:hypothetical protein